MAKIKSRAQAEERRVRVRIAVPHLIGGLPGGLHGGLPGRRTPLDARVVGTVAEQGFHVERVIYDSLPGFHVTADLYLPNHSSGGPDGRVPAVIWTPGHSPSGKLDAPGTLRRIWRGRALLCAPTTPPARVSGCSTWIRRRVSRWPAGLRGEHSEASSQMMLGWQHIAR